MNIHGHATDNMGCFCHDNDFLSFMHPILQDGLTGHLSSQTGLGICSLFNVGQNVDVVSLQMKPASIVGLWLKGLCYIADPLDGNDAAQSAFLSTPCY